MSTEDKFATENALSDAALLNKELQAKNTRLRELLNDIIEEWDYGRDISVDVPIEKARAALEWERYER